MTTFVPTSNNREDAYRLLSACYYAPTNALREEGCCATLAGLLAELSPQAAQQANEAAQLLNQTPLEELLVEYSRLFLGPFKLVAPPYGSVWLDKAKTVMGDSTAQVAAVYQTHGLQLADDFPELPDHIAVELEFLSFLAFQQRQAQSAGNQDEASRLATAQLEFINEFLTPWLTPFCQAIIEDGEAPFYMALAGCTAAFVATDSAALQAAIDA
ncbi:MAG: molecular chaperone [Geobacter sp.]